MSWCGSRDNSNGLARLGWDALLAVRREGGKSGIGSAAPGFLFYFDVAERTRRPLAQMTELFPGEIKGYSVACVML